VKNALRMRPDRTADGRRRETGASMVEYALVLALIVLV